MESTKLKTCKNFENIKRAVNYANSNGVTVKTESDATNIAKIFGRVDKLQSAETICEEEATEACEKCKEFYDNVMYKNYNGSFLDIGLNISDD
jgi:hypothetical protein